jgi:hypothetical protein
MTNLEDMKMFIKIAIATTALVLGTALLALAADHEEQSGGFRELGSGAIITEGVNPADHRSLRDYEESSEAREAREIRERGRRMGPR